MTAANNNIPQGDDGMFPNMIAEIIRDRGPDSTVWGKAIAFAAHCIRHDGIVESTKGIKPHDKPHEEVSREGTSNDARKSFVESLHAEMNRDATTHSMSGTHISRQNTSSDTIGHSLISSHHSHTQMVRDQPNPSIALKGS